MFDSILTQPLVLYLPQAIAVVVGILLSRVIELVPALARWWDQQPDEYKYAYRGWVGLAVAVVLVAFSYLTGLYGAPLETPADWLLLCASVLIAWIDFLGSAEGTYQLTRSSLPRKRRGLGGQG